MKRFLLFFSLLLVSTLVTTTGRGESPADRRPWSMTGTWDITHPTWVGPLTFQEGGTLRGSKNEDIGRWALHIQDGHVLVLLCGWETPVQTVCLVGTDDLFGSVPGGNLRMHRREAGGRAPRQPGFPLPSPLAFPLDGPIWDLVGTWDCTHGTDWSAPLTFQADGTFLKDGNAQEGGKWTLCPQKEGVIVVLNWNGWPAEVVTLFGMDEFRGAPDHGNMRMRRRVSFTPPATVLPPPTALGDVEVRTWKMGEPPLKLIQRDEGFCALMGVSGDFRDNGDAVQVYIDKDDSNWYLSGRSRHPGDVTATCSVIRYRQ